MRRLTNVSVKLVIVICLLGNIQVNGQSKNGFSLSSELSYTTGEQAPFWFRSNQFGRTINSGWSTSFIAKTILDFDSLNSKVLDWGVGFEGRMNVGEKVNFNLIEGYGKIKLGIFELKGGRVKDINGLTDTLLSSGSFTVAGNSFGIPKIQISIPQYYRIPLVGGLFSVKGNISHGWLGEVPVAAWLMEDKAKSFFHQKSMFLRIGKPAWRFNLYGGINQEVIWGDEKKSFWLRIYSVRFSIFYVCGFRKKIEYNKHLARW